MSPLPPCARDRRSYRFLHYLLATNLGVVCACLGASRTPSANLARRVHPTSRLRLSLTTSHPDAIIPLRTADMPDSPHADAVLKEQDLPHCFRIPPATLPPAVSGRSDRPSSRATAARPPFSGQPPSRPPSHPRSGSRGPPRVAASGALVPVKRGISVLPGCGEHVALAAVVAFQVHVRDGDSEVLQRVCSQCPRCLVDRDPGHCGVSFRFVLLNGLLIANRRYRVNSPMANIFYSTFCGILAMARLLLREALKAREGKKPPQEG